VIEHDGKDVVALPAAATELGLVRFVDESGEDYLYAAERTALPLQGEVYPRRARSSKAAAVERQSHDASFPER
jgi:hypothetical protein